MSAYFLDSSALVKRYILERGSAWVEAIVDSEFGNKIFIARITWVEVLSAFARRQREGSLSATEVEQSTEIFKYDLDNQYQLVEVNGTLAEAAGKLVRRHPLRAYDAIQLASALQIQSIFAQEATNPLIFLTADERLNTIASLEGLVTDNPNLY